MSVWRSLILACTSLHFWSCSKFGWRFFPYLGIPFIALSVLCQPEILLFKSFKWTTNAMLSFLCHVGWASQLCVGAETQKLHLHIYLSAFRLPSLFPSSGWSLAGSGIWQLHCTINFSTFSSVSFSILLRLGLFIANQDKKRNLLLLIGGVFTMVAGMADTNMALTQKLFFTFFILRCFSPCFPFDHRSSSTTSLFGD